MLSGDWIGLDLPARYHAFRPQGQFIAMGGATEASIWSNACEINRVPDHWRAIPYGFPLANQRYRVVDELGGLPGLGSGRIVIGGIGVAEATLTILYAASSSFRRNRTRWYRTGDLGCYWPDGTLEFLGRRDKRVKVGGYRIELGEIESALSQLAGSETVNRCGDRRKRKEPGGLGCASGFGFLCYPSSGPGAAPGVARACRNAVLLCLPPEISAGQVADFLQHRLLKLKPGQTPGADPLPLMNARYPASLAGRGGKLVSSRDPTAAAARR